MAKSPVAAPGSPLQTYPLIPGGWQSYPPSRIIEVGTVAGFEAAIHPSNAQPGDIIEIVWPGDYRLTSTAGIPVPNMTIRGHSDATPDDIVIRGRGMDNTSYGNVWHGFYAQQPGLKIQNLTIADFYFHGVTFGAGATAPEFDDVYFRDIGQQFIKASAFPEAINDGRVRRCLFEYTDGRPVTNHFDIDGTTKIGFFYGGAIDVHNGAGWIVEDTVLKEMAPTAAEIAAALALEPAAQQHWWSPAVYFWNKSSNNVVQRCVGINCGRLVAFGLWNRSASMPDGIHDNVGGIIRNNMSVIMPGRIGQAQIDDSDGVILAWNSPGTKILHNTVLTYGQIADAIQGRWATGLEINNNLSDDTIRMREEASFTGANNVQNASPSWFVNPAAGDLHLSSTGNTNVGLATRLADCLEDFDETARAASTTIGADVYG